jgi:hypothetical protein
VNTTTIRTRLEKDLLTANARLRQLGRGVVIDELPGAIGDNSSSADELDESQSTTSLEIGLERLERQVTEAE